MIRHTVAAVVIALCLSTGAAGACSLVALPEMARAAKPVKDWAAYDFTPKAMADGKMLFRRVKGAGLPNGAAEQALLTEHVNHAFSAAYGGKAGRIKVARSGSGTVTFRGGSAAIREYDVEIAQAGDPTPKFAGVVIREIPSTRDLAVIVTPQDPDSPGESTERMIELSKKFAAQPGFECATAPR